MGPGIRGVHCCCLLKLIPSGAALGPLMDSRHPPHRRRQRQSLCAVSRLHRPHCRPRCACGLSATRPASQTANSLPPSRAGTGLGLCIFQMLRVTPECTDIVYLARSSLDWHIPCQICAFTISLGKLSALPAALELVGSGVGGCVSVFVLPIFYCVHGRTEGCM